MKVWKLIDNDDEGNNDIFHSYSIIKFGNCILDILTKKYLWNNDMVGTYYINIKNRLIYNKSNIFAQPKWIFSYLDQWYLWFVFI